MKTIVEIESATRAKLEPHIGKVIKHHHSGRTGKLLVVSCNHFGLETDKGHNEGGCATIKSQLKYIGWPSNYICDKSTVVWWAAVGGKFTVYDGEDPPEPKGTDHRYMDKHQSAAWGVKVYDPPPGAPFEFL